MDMILLKLKSIIRMTDKSRENDFSKILQNIIKASDLNDKIKSDNV